MTDTYEAFYNGKPLNPNRGLPTMSYAQAEDCGLTDSDRLWCCTDGDGTIITADQVPYDSNNSVKDKIDSKINPPNLSNITRESLTSGTAIEVTSTGKWYCVTAENQTSGSCIAYILDASNTNYLSASQTPDGDWKRATTAWLYFPAGTKFYARAIFTYRGQLCSAPCL